MATGRNVIFTISVILLDGKLPTHETMADIKADWIAQGLARIIPLTAPLSENEAGNHDLRLSKLFSLTKKYPDVVFRLLISSIASYNFVVYTINCTMKLSTETYSFTAHLANSPTFPLVDFISMVRPGIDISNFLNAIDDCNDQPKDKDNIIERKLLARRLTHQDNGAIVTDNCNVQLKNEDNIIEKKLFPKTEDRL